MKQRVLVDVDGVLAGFVGNWLRLINAEFGSSFAVGDVTDWDVCASLGLTATDRSRAKRLIAECEGFARRHEVLEGAQAGVRALQQIADVYIVTSPWSSHPTWTHDREWWLDKHFDIGADRIVHTSAKHVVCGDVLLDDKTSTCAAWATAWPSGVAVQWRTPHNRLDAWAGATTSSWSTLIDIVQAVRR